ncbi:MAG: hypothetical protein JO305_00975 [Alphaproteobacteria bacterium]|nr:hypothetical protein [Alphaproteobacteria bacterium]
MNPTIGFQPIEVMTGSQDYEGRLVLADGKLVAVLVRLSDDGHDSVLRGSWYLESGFGFIERHNELFATLEEAAAAIAGWLVGKA